MRVKLFVSLAFCLLGAAPAMAQGVGSQGSAVIPAGPGAQGWSGYADRASYAGPQTEMVTGMPGPTAEGTCEASCPDRCGCECDCWFASVAGLAMGRDKANTFWTSYESNSNANQVLNTNDASSNWSGGFEVTLGHWFDSCPCDARNGIEVVYFYLAPMQGSASVLGSSLGSGTVSTTLDLTTPTGEVQVGGQNTGLFFDGAAEHRITRSDNIQDLELNFIRERLVSTDAAQITWLAGIRYFRFEESLIYGSVQDGHQFGDNGGADEAYLNFHTANNMVGPQVGMRVDYQWGSRLGLFAAPKFGIFGNDVETRSRLYTGDGLQGFDISGHSDTFSVLAQFDLGVNYQVSSHWRAFLGYRLMGVTNVALSDNQIPHYLAASDEMAMPKTNGSLIVHGAMGGVELFY